MRYSKTWEFEGIDFNKPLILNFSMKFDFLTRLKILFTGKHEEQLIITRELSEK